MIVTGWTKEEHLQNIKQILSKLHGYVMEPRIDKCVFFRQHGTHLGYIISADGLKATEECVNAIVNIPTPENVKQLECVIGNLNYCVVP